MFNPACSSEPPTRPGGRSRAGRIEDGV